MIALLASALLSAGADAPAAAPNWVGFNRKDKVALFYDPASVRRAGSRVSVQTRTTVTDDPQGYGSFITVQEIDCKAATMTMVSAQGFDTAGKLYRSVTIPADKREAEALVRGDAYEPLFRTLCRTRRPLPPAPEPLPPPVATPPGTKSR